MRNLNQWVKTDKTLYGWPAIENKLTKELNLASKWGEISVFSDQLALILVRASKRAMALSQTLRTGGILRLKKGDEDLIKIPVSRVQEAINLLRIPKRRDIQIKHANNFGIGQ